VDRRSTRAEPRQHAYNRWNQFFRTGATARRLWPERNGRSPRARARRSHRATPGTSGCPQMPCCQLRAPAKCSVHFCLIGAGSRKPLARSRLSSNNSSAQPRSGPRNQSPTGTAKPHFRPELDQPVIEPADAGLETHAHAGPIHFPRGRRANKWPCRRTKSPQSIDRLASLSTVAGSFDRNTTDSGSFHCEIRARYTFSGEQAATSSESSHSWMPSLPDAPRGRRSPTSSASLIRQTMRSMVFGRTRTRYPRNPGYAGHSPKVFHSSHSKARS
jgi:hypothetical protein